MFISVDVPVLGRRLCEMRNNFSLPTNLGFPNILSRGGAEFGEIEAKENGPLAFGTCMASLVVQC
jgi:(S)-2-hydroxy-acid oxidase